MMVLGLMVVLLICVGFILVAKEGLLVGGGTEGVGLRVGDVLGVDADDVRVELGEIGEDGEAGDGEAEESGVEDADMSRLVIPHATLMGCSWGGGGLERGSGFGISHAMAFSGRGVAGGDGRGELMGAGCCDWDMRVKSDMMEEMSDLGTSSFANMEAGWGCCLREGWEGEGAREGSLLRA
jgi:hypothetical protein